jgi:hypothetical protein
MIDAQRLITRGRLPGLFLYTTTGRLTRHGPYAPIWTSAMADAISLVSSPASSGASQ